MRLAPRHWFSVALFAVLIVVFVRASRHFSTATSLDALSPLAASCALVVAVAGFFVSRAAVRRENMHSRSTQFLKRLMVGGVLFIFTVYATILAVTYGFATAFAGAAVIAVVAAALIWASGTHGMAYGTTIALTVVAIVGGYFGAAVAFNDLDRQVTRTSDIEALEANIETVHDYLKSGNALYTFEDAVGDPQSEVLMLRQGGDRFGHAMVTDDGQFVAVLQGPRAHAGDDGYDEETEDRGTCVSADTQVIGRFTDDDPDIELACTEVPGHDAKIVVEKRVDTALPGREGEEVVTHSFVVSANADDDSYLVLRAITNVELADPAGYADDLLDRMIEFTPREWTDEELDQFIDAQYAAVADDSSH